MMRRIVPAVLFLLVCALAVPGPSSAVNLRWVDDRGVVHFTNDPEAIPEEYRNSAEPVGVGRETMQDLAAKKAQKAVLKYKTLGKAQIIVIEVGGKKVPMVYDADIDATVITHRLQDELALPKLPNSEAISRSKTGALIPVYMVEIPAIKFGNITLSNVQAVVKDFEEEGVDADGIIGQRELEDYDVEIDTAGKMITIKPLQ